MFGHPASKFKIKKFKGEIEPQEIFLDSLAQKKEREFGVSDKKIEIPISQKVLLGFRLSILILIFILFFQTFWLQVFEKDELLASAKTNQFVVRSIQSERGVIYDRNLNQLVFNKPSFDLVCNGQVSKENLDHQSLIFFEVNIEEFPGCEIKNNTAREYISGPIFAHLIGYERKMGEKTGLENQYDSVLMPRPGELKIKRDAKGNLISKEVISLPESGHSLILWLNSALQKILASSLQKSLINTGAKSGAAVALDPRTGGVLALVSFPNFDNNLFSQGISEKEWQKIQSDERHPLFNRAISGVGYPTGSTIKPLLGLAALEEGIITPGQQIYSPLEICVQNPWYPEKQDCYADWMYHGTSDLKRAIAESVNTFFYQIGGGHQDLKGLGATKIKKWLEIFGWGSKTGIDLPKEGEGILPNLEKDWRLGDTYHLSIGQGPFAVTPLQVATAYMALANGGKIFQPRLVQKIIDSDKNIVQKMEPVVVRTVAAKENNLEVVRQGMRQAVTSPQGSSNILNSQLFQAAAKTGTAQTDKENIYHNWVTVFAPYDNPQIVLTVIIENVEGMQAAVLPVAKEFLEWYFSTLDSLDPVRNPR